MSVKDSLEKFLVAEIAAGLGKKAVDPDEDLLQQGIIDSLGLMKLIDFMERSFGIRVSDEDIVPENFQSVYCMTRLVEQQLAGSSAA